MTIAENIAKRLNLPVKGVTAVIEMLDEGATVPFISRYRKERTGSLDEVNVRNIELTLARVRDIEARRLFVIKTLDETGVLTAELKRRLDEAAELSDIEDIYAPYKPKKRTRATIAREKGLEPLARKIMSGYLPSAPDDDIAGASDIIAEWASESIRLRNITRKYFKHNASLVACPAKGKEEELRNSAFAQYADFSQQINRIVSHQYLALRRAEREGLLKLKFDLGSNADRLKERLCEAFIPARSTSETTPIIENALQDAVKRLLRPSIENEISATLKEDADNVAIEIFSSNLRQLLLSPPLKNKRILAIDPGYRTGCKTVALDAQGNLLEETVIYPTAPRNDTEGAHRIIERLIKKHNLEAAAIGNGTASRETEQFLKASDLLPANNIFMVNEDGASVYSASEIARKELPDKDVTVRGAVSIGRRLIDPLAELVKIDPKSIGIGQYQHDVDQSKLKDALDFTVMACVNAVGVDLNTASEKLLSYVAGITPALAANIIKYRTDNGDFKKRDELKKVPRLGPKAYEQAAGFLRIPNGSDPLDNTGIHPESYDAVRAIARHAGVKVTDLPANKTILDTLDPGKLADKGIAGAETINDIITELKKPGRDPRTDNTSTAFEPSVTSFEELHPGMTVKGLVNNITAFGAFVNLGIKENGLIHISQLSPRRVNSVSDILRLGQQIEARVLNLDPARRRISLTLLPG